MTLKFSTKLRSGYVLDRGNIYAVDMADYIDADKNDYWTAFTDCNKQVWDINIVLGCASVYPVNNNLRDDSTPTPITFLVTGAG
jgi:hypothetical protein